MKNIFLGALFFALVGIAYLIKDNKTGDSLQPLLAFEVSNLKEITLEKARIALLEEGPYLPAIEHPADKEKVKSLIEKLKGLRVVKKIGDQSEEESFFSHQDLSVILSFENAKKRLRVGDVSEITGNFYAQAREEKGRKSIYVVMDTSFFEGLYKNEVELNLKKYIIFKNLLTAGPFDLADKRLLGSHWPQKVEKLKIDNTFNRWFSLELPSMNMNPPAPKGIAVKASPETIAEELSKLRFKSFIDSEGNHLTEPLSVIELTAKNEKLVAKLFGSMNGRKGLFAILSDRPERTYELEKEGREIFFASAQAFWDKRPSINRQASLEGLKFRIGKSLEAMREFTLKDPESFLIIGPAGEVSADARKKFNLIFNALFASNGFEQANSVNQLGGKELKAKLAALENPVVYLEFLNKTFAFHYKDEALKLWDLQDKVEFSYAIGEAIESLRADQFFALDPNRG